LELNGIDVEINEINDILKNNHLYVSHFHGETQRENGSRTSTRGRGKTTGLHTGVKQRGNTTGYQTGGNNEKMRKSCKNVTFIVGKQEKTACATH